MPPKMLVLDLDETLVHSSFKPVENADIMLPVEIDGHVCTIYVLVRPYVAQFLKRMHKIYELVIFTASLSKYAEPLMQHLDPDKMCSYLLFREHCTFFNSAYVKDLTRLGRPMKDVIIVDNSPVAYLFQPENAIPAVSWYDDPSDSELQRSRRQQQVRVKVLGRVASTGFRSCAEKQNSASFVDGLRSSLLQRL